MLKKIKTTSYKEKLELAFWILVRILILATAFHFLIEIKNTKTTFNYLKKFAISSITNSYDVAAPRIFFGGKKAEQAVLLLHGFSAAPDEFNELIKKLEQAKIPYFAPLLTGFGIGDFHLLDAVEAKDWIRDAFFAFDFLASFADKVDVIGHSNGGALAMMLAKYRPVNRLILSGPNIFPDERDGFRKLLAETPVLREIGSFLYPVALKPIRQNRVTNVDVKNPDIALNTFHYKAVPTEGVKSLWKLQKIVQTNFSDLQSQKLFLVYGADDQSVDINGLIRELEKQKIPFKALRYENSGHNVLEDYDHIQVNNDIMNILLELPNQLDQ